MCCDEDLAAFQGITTSQIDIIRKCADAYIENMAKLADALERLVPQPYASGVGQRKMEKVNSQQSQSNDLTAPKCTVKSELNHDQYFQKVIIESDQTLASVSTTVNKQPAKSKSSCKGVCSSCSL